MQTSQPDDDDESGDEDEEDDLLLAASKHPFTKVPAGAAKPMTKLPAAPAVVQISEVARQRQQVLAAKLARFKSCEDELEQQLQEGKPGRRASFQHPKAADP